MGDFFFHLLGFTILLLIVITTQLDLSGVYCEASEEIFDPNGEIFENLYVYTNLLENKAFILKTIKGVSGVYILKCLTTGDSYVGSAVELGRRLSEHMRNKNSNPHLQNAFNKYGLQSFVFIVLTTCDPASLVIWEQLAIDLFKPRYNILSIAASLLGFKWSPEQLLGVSGPNNHAYGKPSHLRIPIYCFDAQTHQLIHSFPSVRAAAKSLSIVIKLSKSM